MCCFLRPFISVQSEQEKNNLIGLITAVIVFLCWSSWVVTKAAAAFNFLNKVRGGWSVLMWWMTSNREKNCVFMKSFFDLSSIKMRFLSWMEKMYKFSWYFLGTEQDEDLVFVIFLHLYIFLFEKIFKCSFWWQGQLRKDTEAAATNVTNIRNQGNRQVFSTSESIKVPETLSCCFSFVLASQLRGYVEHKKCYFSHTSHCVWPSNIWLKYLVHYPLCCKKPGIFNPDKNKHT